MIFVQSSKTELSWLPSGVTKNFRCIMLSSIIKIRKVKLVTPIAYNYITLSAERKVLQFAQALSIRTSVSQLRCIFYEFLFIAKILL